MHYKAPTCYANCIKKGMQVAECFERLKTCKETKELFKALIESVDKNVNEERFNEALKLVCKLKGA